MTYVVLILIALIIFGIVASILYMIYLILPDDKSEFTFTKFERLVREGKYWSIAECLEEKPNYVHINHRYGDELNCLSFTNDLKMFKFLMKKGAYPRSCVVIHHFENSNIDIIKYLIFNKNITVTKDCFKYINIWNNNYDLQEYIIENQPDLVPEFEKNKIEHHVLIDEFYDYIFDADDLGLL